VEFPVDRKNGTLSNSLSFSVGRLRKFSVVLDTFFWTTLDMLGSLALLLLSFPTLRCWSPSLGDFKHSSLVVVRWKKNTNETLPYSKYPHFLYNRGGHDVSSEYNVIDELSNVGREGFVYMKHLYQHYHNLSDITIFSQFDHLMRQFCPTVKKILSGGHLSPQNDGFAYVGHGCMRMAPIPFEVHYRGKREDVPNHFLNLLGPKYIVPNPRWIPSAFFAVTKEAIHRNPRTFYRDFARRLGSKNNPYEGHFLERAWPEVFLSNCSATEVFNCK
jgi:hypothetical protein